MKTSLDELQDKLEGHAKEADDFFISLFHLDALLASANALHRSREQPMAKEVLQFGAVAINQDKSSVSMKASSIRKIFGSRATHNI